LAWEALELQQHHDVLVQQAADGIDDIGGYVRPEGQNSWGSLASYAPWSQGAWSFGVYPTNMDLQFSIISNNNCMYGGIRSAAALLHFNVALTLDKPDNPVDKLRDHHLR
jgi:hypothetical protein